MTIRINIGRLAFNVALTAAVALGLLYWSGPADAGMFLALSLAFWIGYWERGRQQARKPGK